MSSSGQDNIHSNIEYDDIKYVYIEYDGIKYVYIEYDGIKYVSWYKICVYRICMTT